MSVIEILYVTTDITDDVVIENCRFVSMANGRAGDCTIRVKDPLQNKVFIAGKPLALKIDGEYVWRGFVAQVQRVYGFPALDVDDSTTRFLEIRGIDINVLFNKRVLFDTSNPTNLFGPLYTVDTASDVVLADMFAGFLDLSGDGIDTSTFVEDVGDVNFGQEARPFGPTTTWGQAVAKINRLPNGVWYIDPDKNFVYTDVDTPNAPYEFSDDPDGVTSVGYREMRYLTDGSQMANDFLAWGVRQIPIVFARETDAASVAEHGLWQGAAVDSGIYKQASINRLADAVVNGSPSSKRGRKDDRLSVNLATHQPGFRVAMKARVINSIYDLDTVLPIRQMQVTFKTGNPKYSLLLSHEIDSPVGFFDPLQWKPIDWDIGRIIWPPPPPPPGCICISADGEVLDDFEDRTVAPDGWGIASSGFTWAAPSPDDGDASVSGGVGRLQLDTATYATSEVWVTMPVVPDYLVRTRDIHMLVKVNVDYIYPFDGFDYGANELQFDIWNAALRLDLIFSYESGVGGLIVGDNGASPQTMYSEKTDWELSTWYLVRLVRPWDGSAKVKIWKESDPEPSAWALEYTATPATVSSDSFRVRWTAGGDAPESTDEEVDIDYIKFFGVDRCSEPQFDDFERTDSAAWGNATPSGILWSEGAGGFIFYAVDGNEGSIRLERYGTFDQPIYDLSSRHTRAPVSGYLPSTGIFRMDTEFVMTADGHMDNMIGIDLDSSSPNAAPDSYVRMWNYSSDGGPALRLGENGTVVSTSMTYTLGVTYRLAWERTATEVRAKIWSASSSEPAAWDLSQSAAPVVQLDHFKIVTQMGGSGTTDFPNIAFSYIDFDYTGKPCYYDCSGCSIDDTFDRTVAAPDWGGQWTNLQSTADSDGVSGGIANLADVAGETWTLSASVQAEESNYELDLTTCPADSTPPWDIVVEWQASNTFESEEAYTSSGSPPPGTVFMPRTSGGVAPRVGYQSLTFWFRTNIAGNAFGPSFNPLGLRVTMDDTGAYWGETANAPGGAVYSPPTSFTFINDEPYKIRIQITEDRIKMKLWRVSSGEPGTWAIDRAGSWLDIDDARPSEFNIKYIRALNGYPFLPLPAYSYDYEAVSIDILDVQFSAGGCIPVYAPDAVGATGSFWCETAVRETSTTYSVSKSFLRGTTEVYVNGLYQRPGTEYDESPSDDTLVVMSAPLDPIDIVRVCYVVA